MDPCWGRHDGPKNGKGKKKEKGLPETTVPAIAGTGLIEVTRKAAYAALRVRPYFFFAAFFLAFFFAFAMLASPVNRVSPRSEYIDAKLNYKRARVC
jgi:hypothetical protein